MIPAETAEIPIAVLGRPMADQPGEIVMEMDRPLVQLNRAYYADSLLTPVARSLFYGTCSTMNHHPMNAFCRIGPGGQLPHLG